jgi:hypothetical protein
LVLPWWNWRIATVTAARPKMRAKMPKTISRVGGEDPELLADIGSTGPGMLNVLLLIVGRL